MSADEATTEAQAREAVLEYLTDETPMENLDQMALAMEAGRGFAYLLGAQKLGWASAWSIGCDRESMHIDFELTKRGKRAVAAYLRRTGDE